MRREIVREAATHVRKSHNGIRGAETQRTSETEFYSLRASNLTRVSTQIQIYVAGGRGEGGREGV